MKLKHALFAAAIVHAGLLLALGPRLRAPIEEHPAERTIEIALEPVAPPEQDLPKNTAPSPIVRGEIARPALRSSRAGTQVDAPATPSSGEASAEPGGVAEPTAATSAPSASPIAILRAPDLLAGGARFDVAPDAQGGPDPAGMRAELTAHDHALGLGSGGPLIEAARDATSRSLAPVDGYALFEALVSKSGEVSSVRVVDASADLHSWEEVATGIRDAVKAKHLHVPKGASGLAVRVRVDSRWQMPDGSAAAPTKVCFAPLPCNVVPRGRSITISPLGVMGNVLPDTIGLKPLRVVHARIVEERAL